MKIDGITPGHVAAQAMKAAKQAQSEPSVETEVPQETVENADSEEKAAGVLRLLEAGHFKGVADIRLRINFHEELMAMEAEGVKSAAAERFEGFNQSVQEQAAVLKESGLLNEDQLAALDAFLNDLQTTQTGFLDDQGGSAQSLIEGLQQDLDSFLALLTPAAPDLPQAPPLIGQETDVEEQTADVLAAEEPVVMPADEEPPVELFVEEASTEAIIPEDPLPILADPAEEPDPLQQLVQRFQDSVQTLIDTLNADLQNTSVLPPLSAPTGNGKAYAKFMSIYENMLS